MAARGGSVGIQRLSGKTAPSAATILSTSSRGSVITGPAGSMASGLASTWHKPGANVTDRARRAVLCYFSRSWVKGYSDLRSLVTEKQAAAMSPTLRYLVGFSANAPVRRGPEPDSE